MDKQTFNDALLGMLNSAIAAVEKGATFLAGEIPDVIHQLLLYKLVVALLPWLGVVVFGTLAILLFNKANRLTQKKQAAHALYVRTNKRHVEQRMKAVYERYDSLETVIGIASIVCAAPAIFLLLIAIFNIGDAIQIAVAPKVYLLEYAAKFIK